jgi:putative nucleotidyltransferase with HDIG domain
MGVVANSVWQFSSNPPNLEYFVLAALTLLTGSFTVKLPSLPAKLSVSETFVFTSVLMFGPAAGTITVVIDSLVGSLWMRRQTVPRVLFNFTAPAIAIRVASEAFFYLSAASPGQIHRNDVALLILPVFAFACLYFAINTALVSFALATERKQTPLAIWRANFPPVSITYFVGSSIAMFIVAFNDRIDFTVLSIIVPLLVISYVTFRTSMGRVEDADRHVSQVNELYLSTIEALALAVDAKDQITHGHIRRVQVYTVELAKRLGVRDVRQLKAIEAAALLHDMGKLAIPEHILNKPGKLTTAEFDKMKRHADIGADLLSSIKFPYPVVPIVRHHHENWDGKGYPTGISGTDIPLGARILSVVDCFDALTSDRPYRPRLSTEEAFDIIRQRRGNMYDPLVVDSFIAAYDELAPIATEAGLQARSLVGETTFAPEPEVSALNEIRTNASEVALLEQCAQQISSAPTNADAINAAWQTLRQLTPITTCALFRYESSADQLVCQSSAGDSHNLLPGLVIRLGERVTGWCAANQKIAMNSDAHLDLIQMATRFTPPLRSTICVPLMNDERSTAVFTGYSTQESPFEDRHRYAVERVAELLNNRSISAAQSGGNIRAFPAARHR